MVSKFISTSLVSNWKIRFPLLFQSRDKGKLFFPFFLAIAINLQCSQPILRENEIIIPNENSNPGSMIVSQPIFSKDFFRLKNNKHQYNQNQYIGFIRFSGGLVYETHKSGGDLATTKEITFEFGKEYEEEIRTRLVSLLSQSDSPDRRIVIDKQIDVKLLREEDLISTIPHKDEGNQKDNINQPVYRYNFKKILDRNYQDYNKYDVLIVPVVHAYYSHTAGWFKGQTWGTSPGYRIVFSMVGYDLRSKSLIFQYFIDEKEIYYGIYSLNHNQNEEMKMNLWKKIEVKIHKILNQ